VTSVARKLSRKEERRQDERLFRREYYRDKGHKLQNSRVRVLVKVLDLEIIFSYDIQRYASNDQAYGKLSGNKD
jgi:hypothetical protein